MMKKAIWIGLALSVLGLVAASTARADDRDKKTVLTFTQPVEIPGRVLPAGTYMFKMLDSWTDRHVVQIFNEDGSTVIASVLTVPNYRRQSTNETVIRFREMPAGTPEAIRAWFYPGSTIGEEFVYSKVRAAQLAKLANAPVPASVIEVTNVAELKTAPLVVAITPEAKEVVLVIPPPVAVQPVAAERTELPKTASTLPLVLLAGFAAIGLAFGLLAFGKRTSTPAL